MSDPDAVPPDDTLTPEAAQAVIDGPLWEAMPPRFKEHFLAAAAKGQSNVNKT